MKSTLQFQLSILTLALMELLDEEEGVVIQNGKDKLVVYNRPESKDIAAILTNDLEADAGQLVHVNRDEVQ